MIKLFPFVCLIFFGGCNHPTGQDAVSTVEKSSCDTALRAVNIETKILLGCGIAGSNSWQLDSTAKFVTRKDYRRISENLFSADPVLQIASVVALETLDTRGLYRYQDKEKEKINAIKTSTTPCYVCQGCTGHFKGTVSEIFDINTPGKFTEAIKYKMGLLPE
jgi:hypothetical protein